MFFTFPEDARWNADRQAVEFGVEIGEYHGVVWVLWRVFQHFWRSGRPRAVCRSVLPPADTLRASLSVNSAGAYLPRTATSKSRGATCARAPGALLSVAAWQRQPAPSSGARLDVHTALRPISRPLSPQDAPIGL